MTKKLWILALSLAITFGGVYSLIKLNPPLEIGTLASNEDNKSIVVEVGNKGFREIKILDVSVNNNEKPAKTKIQVSNALQGFIITDDYNNDEFKKYGFKNTKDVSIKVGTSPSSNFKKLDDGNASEKDEIYGVSIIHSETINKVHIKYSYLGVSFNESVFFNYQGALVEESRHEIVSK